MAHSQHHHSSSSPCSACLYEHGIDTRVVVIGSSGVGKTSLIQRYTHSKFEPPTSTPTTAPSFVTKKVHVDETKVRLQLWDTPGRASFRTMAPMYYRDADAALLLYDTAKPSTCDALRAWLEELRRNSPDLLIYIVGINHNASDLGCDTITPSVVRRLIRSWFPPTKQTAAPPPSPATKTNSFASFFRLPFRSFSLPSPPPSPQPNEPLDLSASLMVARGGARYQTLHAPSHRPSSAVHAIRSEQDGEGEDDNENCLPNKVVFMECDLYDGIAIDNLFQKLLQHVVYRTRHEGASAEDDDDMSASHCSSLSSSLSERRSMSSGRSYRIATPPLTASPTSSCPPSLTPSPRMAQCYPLPVTKEEPQPEDHYPYNSYDCSHLTLIY
ncbi:hypothetical protein ONZ45_g7744 [Pleurotus djamor]|nr:hypothetical protein ONZ45_g7744 [Pleurotus djamor]